MCHLRRKFALSRMSHLLYKDGECAVPGGVSSAVEREDCAE